MRQRVVALLAMLAVLASVCGASALAEEPAAPAAREDLAAEKEPGPEEAGEASLRAEGEAKAQGRTALQDKVAGLNEESARYSAQMAGLEGEQSALRQSIGELERLREDLSGDTASRNSSSRTITCCGGFRKRRSVCKG